MSFGRGEGGEQVLVGEREEGGDRLAGISETALFFPPKTQITDRGTTITKSRLNLRKPEVFLIDAKPWDSRLFGGS